MKVESPVIVALDYPDQQQALAMAEQLDPTRCRVKVGKELFTRAGPELLKALHQRRFEVFLDLKFHDIPNTVAKACQAACDLGVWMLNVHASGGAAMMERAQEAVLASGTGAKLIAVTVLTSMSAEDLHAIGLAVSPQQQVLRLAKLAQQSGLPGVVCSAQEALMLRGELSPEFELVTPGIRPAGADLNDQKRVMTPAEACQAGVNYLVIGRPITQASQPIQALEAILASL